MIVLEDLIVFETNQSENFLVIRVNWQMNQENAREGGFGASTVEGIVTLFFEGRELQRIFEIALRGTFFDSNYSLPILCQEKSCGGLFV